MKRTMKLSIWGALIVFANHLNARDMKSSLDVNMIGSKTFELTMDNLKGEVEFSLLNEREGVMYKEKFDISTDGSLKKTFDLGLFPDGNYSIKLADLEKTQSFPISITNNKLTVNTLKKEVHYLSVLYKRDNKITVSLTALEKDYFEISVLNNENKVVYEASLKGYGNMGKIFDFSKSRKGGYTFLLTSKAGCITKNIAID